MFLIQIESYGVTDVKFTSHISWPVGEIETIYIFVFIVEVKWKTLKDISVRFS